MQYIISKYKENISWVNRLNSNYIVYNKDESDTNKNFINLPNKGREAHTYLTHIVNNYETLDDITCFLQGDPFPHLYGTNLEEISNIKFESFFPFGITQICNLKGEPQNPYLDIDEIFLNKYFLNKPENYITYTIGAQFLVKKSTILKRKKIFYENILKDFERMDIPVWPLPLTIDKKTADPCAYTYIQKTGDSNRMPWLLERVWNIIFNENFISKFDS
jgi:hypothetical protein